MTQRNNNTQPTAALLSPFILIKGAGEMASAIAWRLFMANMRRICMLDLENPLCVRRRVSFCTSLESGHTVVEGIAAVVTHSKKEILSTWVQGKIATCLVENWEQTDNFTPDVIVDAILAKKNLGTSIDDAPLVIALGPGFTAATDCHLVIETNRGHDLGRIVESGPAAPNTGIPGNMAGFTAQRVLRAPVAGRFETEKEIGDPVRKGEVIGYVNNSPIPAELDGILRGLIRPGTELPAGMKLGDIDPRGNTGFCDTISDKARAISGSVLEAVMRHCNRV